MSTSSAVKDILELGDERLRTKSALVDMSRLGPKGALLDDFTPLMATLEDFRRRNGFGRAISAPQIGMMERVIAMNLGDTRGTFLLVNPSVTWRSAETFSMWDDCFSFPWLMVRVRRHSSISVTFKDHLGHEHTWDKLDQALSELLEHEIDHLDGVLAVDRQEGSEALLSRRLYLERRAHWDSLVDYGIKPPTNIS